MIKTLLGLAVLAISLASALPAHADGELKKCAVGDRVTDRQNKSGTVRRIQDAGTTCFVQLDGATDSTLYLMWMLHLEGTSRIDLKAVASVAPGRYACYSASGMGKNRTTSFNFSDVVIQSRSDYSALHGGAGKYSYDPATQLFTFHSGFLQGTYAKYIKGNEIGLSLKPITADTFFATACDLHR